MPAGNMLLYGLSVFAAVGCGMMAGLFFVFSSFVMRALAAQAHPGGMTAMQSINVLILNPLFMILFMGTALASLAVLILLIHRAVVQVVIPGTSWLAIGCLLYLVGCIGVTMACNVPRNDRLAATRPEDPKSEAIWQNYLKTWTAWNHVRTAATALGTIALVVGVSRLSSTTSP